MRSLVLAAMALAMEIASMKPTREMMTALAIRSMARLRSRLGRARLGRPEGMSPTTLPPCSAKPIAQLATVVTTTATRTPGSLGTYFFMPHMMAKAATPMIRVGKWVPPNCCSTPRMSWMKCSLRGIETPKILLS